MHTSFDIKFFADTLTMENKLSLINYIKKEVLVSTAEALRIIEMWSNSKTVDDSWYYLAQKFPKLFHIGIQDVWESEKAEEQKKQQIATEMCALLDRAVGNKDANSALKFCEWYITQNRYLAPVG